MSDDIKNALTAEEWAEKRLWFPAPPSYSDWVEGGFYVKDGELVMELDVEGCDRDTELRPLPALIALANAALPDSDPRKITRAHVGAIRHELDEEWPADAAASFPHVELLYRLADALESYLPPETPTP